MGEKKATQIYVIKLPLDQREAFRDALLKKFKPVYPLPITNPYEFFRVKYGKAMIIGYTSGKVVATQEDAKPIILEILKELKLEPSEYDVIIGSDEAGKGEWLGPLTIAAVALTPEGMLALRAEGVMDSKELGRRRIEEISRKIKKLALGFQVFMITPRRFNKLLKELWEGGQNLNDLIAWGHARAIDSVYKKVVRKMKDASFVIIIDEFDRLKTEERLQRIQRLRSIKVVQAPDAEDVVAVAAAGILAKAAWEAWIDRESEKLSLDLRKISPMDALKIEEPEAYFKIPYLQKMLGR
ncbi:hypothetical protein KEJ36_00120 [Candidatus Bathyarchaeota archaeon]|nr:hypothetical protein [Candidatus Bathyarchaeota archaeon]MBS7627230.1 hypothetical protein [Candidatus Bathyarchaeota archaeon]